MTDIPAGAAAFRYRAFISYSHRDAAWADWLHKAVERYRVPRALVGKTTVQGVVPARLTPLFRDREELPAATDLSTVITAALESAAHLVVLCSPRAAQSQWVNEEILAFKRLGRAGRIVAIIVEGEPNSGDPATECFPPALKQTLDGLPTEPVAADARESGDGKENAKLKLIAGLLGVGLDDLKRREAQAQRRRTLFAYSLTGVFALLAVAAVFFAFRAEEQRNRAEMQEKEAVTQRDRANLAVDAARTTAERMVTDFTQRLRTAPGASMAVFAEILERSVMLMDNLAKSGPLGSRELYALATALSELAQADQLLGNSTEGTTEIKRAIAILADLATRPDAPPHTRTDLATAWDTLGNLQSLTAGYEEALTAFETARDLRLALLAETPDDRELQRAILVGWQKIGEAQYALSNNAAARKAWEAQLDLAEKLDPGWPKHTAVYRRDLPRALASLGSLLPEFGEQETALAMLRRSEALSAGLLADFPDNLSIINDMGGIWARLGSFFMHRGRADDARLWLQKAVDIREELYLSDPDDLRWGQNLYESHANLSAVAISQKDYHTALTHTRRALDVLEKMIEKKPDVPAWNEEAVFLRQQKSDLERRIAHDGEGAP